MNGMVRTAASRSNAEAGNAMVVALLVLFLLTSLGVSYVAVTKGDKQVAGNQLVSSQAFSNAEAGISEVLARMSDSNVGAPIYLGTQVGAWVGGEVPGNYHPGWGRYVVTDPGNSGLDPQYDATTSDGLDNNGQGSTDEGNEHYPEIGSRQNSVIGLSVSDRLDYPWVKVRYKLDGANQIVLFGDHDNNPATAPRENTVRGVPKLIITSAGRRGTGQKVVTVEAVKWPLPPIPGSVYTEGQMIFNGNAFYIDGHDHNYTAPYDTVSGAPPLAGISTPNNPADISSNLGGNQYDNVQGSGTDPSVQPSNVNLDLPALAAAWGSMADITMTGDQNNPNTSTWGSMATIPPTMKVVHIAGDLHISGSASGAGVLVIDGDLDLSGSFNWNGVVLCMQDVTVTGGGTAKQIMGCLMVQGTVNDNSNLNGNIKLLYSSAMINQLNTLTRYEVSSWIDQ